MENYSALTSPAKLNLHLAVGGRRPDGFHNLESVFAALQFGDTLELTAGPGFSGRTALSLEFSDPALEVFRELRDLPAEKNLAFRAVEAFRDRTGYRRDLSLRLLKRIPPGAGLGGGSSNAAAVLTALNALAENAGLSREELFVLGAALGSDVPFFLSVLSPGSGGNAAWVTGRGERLEPLSLPAWPVLVVYPGFASTTPRAYALLDEARAVPGAVPGGERVSPVPGGDPGRWPYKNDFLEVFLSRGTETEQNWYRVVVETLMESGALFSSLSGSGSACFGIFGNVEASGAAAVYVTQRLSRILPESLNPFIQNTFFLAC